ncbi:C-C chemokine receptor type 3-like [Gastrophryne carolinensis]
MAVQDFEATTPNNFEEPLHLCSNADSISFGAVVVPVFYYMVFAVSLWGNGLILFLLLKFENIKTVTNVFIFNLVISDLLFTVSLQFWGYYHNHEWIFGESLCKAVSSIFYIGSYSSIFFLTMMTVDRYVAVVHAIQAARMRKLVYVYVASAVIWVMSLFSTIPKFVLYGTRNDPFDGMLCEETGYEAEKIQRWKKVGRYQQLILYFLLPLVVILYCYTMIVFKLYRTKIHNKDKAMKLILMIVVVFFICWTPYNIVILMKAKRLDHSSESGECNDSIDYVFYICRNIAYLHCCTNPFFYIFVGTKFRRHMAPLFANWTWTGRTSAQISVARRADILPKPFMDDYQARIHVASVVTQSNHTHARLSCG